MTRRLLIAVLLVAPAARAAETGAFLDAGAGARAESLGGAAAALSDDFSAVYWNPAGLARLEKKEAGASHGQLAQDARLDFLGYVHPLSAAVFAAAVTYLSRDRIEGRDAAGHPAADFSASDAAGAVALARKTDLVDFGASLKLIQSHVASAQATSAAVDAGVARELGGVGPGRLRLAATVRNLGPGLRYDRETNDLPTRLTAAAAYRLPRGHAIEVDWIQSPRTGANDACLGFEARVHENAFLRLGWSSRGVSGGSGLEAAQGLAMGIGLTNGRWSFDYGVRAAGELGLDHRFDLRARW